MCQYLASEVHKPFLESVPLTKPSEVVKVVQKTILSSKKKSPLSKKSSSSKKVETVPALSIKPSKKQQQQPAEPVVAETLPPTPVVSQLMEMGFERRFVEYAIQTTASTTPERLITWLLEHQGMEPPEAVGATPTSEATPLTATGGEVEAAVVESSDDGRDLEESVTSSDSDLTKEEVGVAGSKGENRCLCTCSHDSSVNILRELLFFYPLSFLFPFPLPTLSLKHSLALCFLTRCQKEEVQAT